MFLEASIDAFYEPARKALLPHIVPQSQLHLAATIDSTVWSVVTTFATGLGGAIATTMGACVCVWCMWGVVRVCVGGAALNNNGWRGTCGGWRWVCLHSYSCMYSTMSDLCHPTIQHYV